MILTVGDISLYGRYDVSALWGRVAILYICFSFFEALGIRASSLSPTSDALCCKFSIKNKIS